MGLLMPPPASCPFCGKTPCKKVFVCYMRVANLLIFEHWKDILSFTIAKWKDDAYKCNLTVQQTFGLVNSDLGSGQRFSL